MATTQHSSPINKETGQKDTIKYKGNFTRLTDPDINYEEFHAEDIIYKLHSEYEMTKSRVNEEIHKFFTIH